MPLCPCASVFYSTRNRFHSSRQDDVIFYTHKVNVDIMCFILIAHFFSFILFLMNTETIKKSMSYRYTYSHLFLIPALTHMRICMKLEKKSNVNVLLFLYKGNRRLYESCDWSEQCTGSNGANQCRFVEGIKICHCPLGYSDFDGSCLKGTVYL